MFIIISSIHTHTLNQIGKLKEVIVFFHVGSELKQTRKKERKLTNTSMVNHAVNQLKAAD